MKEQYKLVGILNLFEVVPDFVYPIFEKDNKYYFCIGSEEELKIKDFELENFSNLKKIKYLSDIKSNLSEEIILTKDSEPIFAFQSSYEYVYIGFFKEFKEFFENYEYDDEILKEEIKDFFDVVGTNV